MARPARPQISVSTSARGRCDPAHLAGDFHRLGQVGSPGEVVLTSFLTVPALAPDRTARRTRR